MVAGLDVFYIPTTPWEHLGAFNGIWDDYKLIKEYSLVSNCGLHHWRKENYAKVGYYCPPPVFKPEL
jgi:hypothetical protein